MKIQEIYEKYKIPSFLQEHQLRVAAVASLLCKSIKNEEVDTDNIIKVCLLHDMGNIIKFDLDQNIFDHNEEELNYLKEVKKEMISKYGPEEHIATKKIISELGLDKKIETGVDLIGFSKLQNTVEKGSIENKICSYSDMRVGPSGVISIDERMKDGENRYPEKSKKEYFKIGKESLYKIEKQIFSYMKILPQDISDASIFEELIALREYRF